MLPHSSIFAVMLKGSRTRPFQATGTCEPSIGTQLPREQAMQRQFRFVDFHWDSRCCRSNLDIYSTVGGDSMFRCSSSSTSGKHKAKNGSKHNTMWAVRDGCSWNAKAESTT